MWRKLPKSGDNSYPGYDNVFAEHVFDITRLLTRTHDDLRVFTLFSSTSSTAPHWSFTAWASQRRAVSAFLFAAASVSGSHASAARDAAPPLPDHCFGVRRSAPHWSRLYAGPKLELSRYVFATQLAQEQAAGSLPRHRSPSAPHKRTPTALRHRPS